MARVMEEFRSRGVYAVGFGDLFLEDLRAWRENNLAKAGMSGVFPIWKRDTRRLARQIIAMGFKAILSCVEGKVGPGFVGRPYDERLLDDLPAGIDPCGEYGEFHSFVSRRPGLWSGPSPVDGRQRPSSGTGDITRTCFFAGTALVARSRQSTATVQTRFRRVLDKGRIRSFTSLRNGRSVT